MPNSFKCRVLTAGLLLAAALITGCGSENPRRIVEPPGPPLPPPVFQSGGSVSDTANRPLASATVEILDGPYAGTSVTTDGNGTFLIPAISSGTAVRALKENYLPSTQTWPPAAGPANSRLSFYLAPVGPSVVVAGDYALTLIPDAGCGFPAMLQTRTYGLRITPSAPSTNRPDGTLFTGVLSGAALLQVPTEFVGIAVAGNFVVVGLFGPEGDQAVERVAPNTYFAFNSGASGSADPSSATFLSAPARGTLDICTQSTPPTTPYLRCEGEGSRCFSENHRLILVKR